MYLLDLKIVIRNVEKNFVCPEKVVSLHRFSKTVGYGVMVTLQILVLSFLVRIQVAQRRASLNEEKLFLYLYSLSLGKQAAETYC